MESIFEGTIKNGALVGQGYMIRKLTEDDLADILHVQEEVVFYLEKKETLQPLTREEFAYILEGNGLMLGAYTGDKLIAFRALLVPTIDGKHLGWDIGLPEDEWPKVIYQEISSVLPAYRGNRLQKTLATLIMQELAKKDHPYRYICCTVAPFNIPSLKDKFSQGMQIAALKKKYGGQLRYIFVKDLARDPEVSWMEITSVQMDDISTQKEKLAEGYRGIHMEYKGGSLWVHYGRN